MSAVVQKDSPQASGTRRLGVGFVTQLAGRFGATGVAFFTVAIAARYYGPSEYGQIVAALAVATLFTAFGDFGLNAVITRQVANSEANLETGLNTGFGLTVIYGAALVLASNIMAFSLYGFSSASIAWLVLGLAPFIYLQCLGSSMTPAFQVHNQFAPYAVGEFTSAVVTFALLLVAIRMDASVWGYVVAANVAALLRVCILIAGARRLVRVSPKFKPSVWIDLLKQAIPMGAIAAIGIVYFRIDTILLSTISTADQLGIYGLAYRIVGVVSMLPGLLVTSSFYSLAKSAASARAFQDQTARVVATLLNIVLPIAIVGIVCARDVALLAGGDLYAPAAGPLGIMLVAVVLRGVNTVLGASLQSAYRQRPVLVLSLVALIINVAVLVALVPSHGATGAAIAMLASEGFSALGILAVGRASLSFALLLPRLAPCIIGAAGMSAVLGIVDEQFLIKVALGGITYCILFLALHYGVRRLQSARKEDGGEDYV